MAQSAATPIAFGRYRAGSTTTTATGARNMDDSPSLPDRNSEDARYSQFAIIKLRLSPLALAEDLLIRRLASPGGEEGAISLGAWATADPSGMNINGSGNTRSNGRIKEVFVRSGSNWKGLFSSKEGRSPNKSANGVPGLDIRRQPQHDPFLLVSACRDDMMMVWNDQIVRTVLREKGIRLDEMDSI
ncbi:hypothetical protein FRB95_010991 [Tulasnella sp. JGI-2019a]|nr:hypothetical protein FRB93_006819 [Tulasnella sp. JGI-2019a]KAG9024823.1 hypothetical protein FRB95_010991 [Tulasnella sp. JGI-2019a]